MGLNPSNEVFGKSEEMKMNAIVKFMDEVIEDLLSIYKAIGKEANKSL